jgi:YidC/Oxa1 family membrane protein insertase
LEKRTIIALILIIVIFYISSEFIWKPKQQAIQQESQALQEQTEHLEQEVMTPLQETVSIAEPDFVIEKDIAIDDNIILKNELMKITFSNQGASIREVELSDYLDKNKEKQVNLIRENATALHTVLFDQSGQSFDLSSMPFTYQIFDKSVEFTFQNQDISIRKMYRITDSYNIDFTFEVDHPSSFSAYKIGFADGIADTETFLKDKKNDYRIYAQIENQITNKTLNKLKEPVTVEGKIDWLAVRSKYFLLALIPGDLVYPEKATFFSTDNLESPAFFTNVDIAKNSISHQYHLYMGPLVEKELEKFGIGLDNTIQMGPGILRWLSKLFQAFFNLLFRFIPQWGVCIIIFSFFMKLILYPLTHKSFESSMKMQEVQPKMKAVQEKYKHDPRLMNKEVQKLYKEHGVNPMSGCLPMLPQLPIFIALMPIFRNAIDLRQAEFLWMTDLSEPDPYLILPIIMAVFMFVQQFLMRPPQQNMDEMDDKQKAALQSQKMMGYIMPIVMFFLFKSFPAGLVIYWTTFNIFSLFQQYYIRKKFGSYQPIQKN